MLSIDCWRRLWGLTHVEITSIILPRWGRASMENKFYVNIIGIQINCFTSANDHMILCSSYYKWDTNIFNLLPGISRQIKCGMEVYKATQLSLLTMHEELSCLKWHVSSMLVKEKIAWIVMSDELEGPLLSYVDLFLLYCLTHEGRVSSWCLPFLDGVMHWTSDGEMIDGNILYPSRLARHVVEEKIIWDRLLYTWEYRLHRWSYICNIELNVVGEIVIRYIRNLHSTQELLEGELK
jgi:hypothetical protein